MPVPKRKCSKIHRDMRRSHHKLTAPNLSACQSCGDRILPHRVCPKCGHYKDRLIRSSDED